MVPISKMEENERRRFDDLIKNHITIQKDTTEPYINKIRNGFVHGHFRFHPKPNNLAEIGFIEVWDCRIGSTEKNFHATIYEAQLLDLIDGLYNKLSNDYKSFNYDKVL